ncbi:hypothetical protein [Streptomyces sp. NPDC029526]|uniref:hypothetical protein n=1 Tax=Streptomyces sp. NPDC029526 TaxID=3155728 RepID=UPI0033C918BA
MGATAAARSVMRARVGSGLVVAVLLLPVGSWALARAGVVAEAATIPVGLLAMIAGYVLLTALWEERSPFRHAPRSLTARTLTGPRTVDLGRITTVRLVTTFSQAGVYRTVVVRDADGVRLGLTTGRSREHLRRAVEQAENDAGRGATGLRVSRAAAAHLGLPRGRGLAVHTVLAFLCTMVGMSLYLSVVFWLGGQ